MPCPDRRGPAHERDHREVMLAMRAYELMIIFDGDLEDDVVDERLSAAKATAEAAGGEIKTTDSWGRRKFAYEIDHKSEGFYVVLEILAEGGALDELERTLRLADDVVRHLLIRLPDNEAARRGLLGETPATAG
jgi:small subunit ribosomal protein S6